MNRCALLAAIILFTVAVRLVFCLIVYPSIAERASLQGHDRYDTIARHLLQGSGYTIDPSGPPTTKRLPLYPILLYLAYSMMGAHTWALHLVQVCLAGVTAWLIVLIGRILFSETVGLLAAALFSVHPHLVQYTARPYTETLFVLLVCLLAYLLLDIPGAAPAQRGLMTGGVYGLALLTKGVVLWFFPFFFLGWLAARSPRKSPAACVTYLGGLLIGVLLILSPWVYRNYALTGRLILTSTVEGAPLYDGLYVSSHLGDGRTPSALDEAARMERRRIIEGYLGPIRGPIDEYRADRMAYALAIDTVLAHPFRSGKHVMRNLFLVWFLTRTRVATLLALLYHLPLLGLALYGLVWLVRHDRLALEKTWAAISLIVYFNVIYAMAFPFVRYILPVVPLVMVLGGFGLLKALERRRLPLRRAPCDIGRVHRQG